MPSNAPMMGNHVPATKVEPHASARLHEIIQQIQQMDGEMREILRRRERLVEEAHESLNHMRTLEKEFEENKQFVDDTEPGPHTNQVSW